MTVVSHNVSTRLQVTERTDTDGDSLWDAWENKTYQYDKSFLLSGRSGVSAEFSTDWQDPDTDGDYITDGEEYSVQRVAANQTSDETYLIANSSTHPGRTTRTAMGSMTTTKLRAGRSRQ